ncbi:MAG TPA: FAD-dependent oxidoreductase [Candidatus Ornithoclostridium excrementipullorum]|nr:FAD-dependent oxidoreductase [Candidatus Ornithoclostridium excrementipullorum]
MDKKYEALFTPWKIRDVEIKNRIVLCPMGGTSLFGWMEPNHFDKEAANFFMQRAKQNVGLIIPGIAPLRDTIGGRWLYQNKKMFAQLKEYMTELHKTGAKLFVQLTAGFGRSFAITDALKILLTNKTLGKIVKPIIDAEYLCASPSELPSRWAEDVMCRAVTVDEIRQMVYAFGETARLCKEAGVDGVEVHAVHEGYLLDQFTLKYTNRRKDEYGGSFENRYRFPVEVVREIKSRCGEDYPVSLRYSVISKTKDFCVGAIPGEEYVEVGRDMEESEKAAKYLQDAGYDMLNADNGTYDAWYWAHPPAYMPLNCNLDDVAHIKKFVDIPVVCAGRMEPDTASQAIADGRIDGMGVARQFLTDPEWVTKLMEGREEDIQPCICCHNACFAMAHYKGVANDEAFDDVSHMARCALNPRTMQEKKFEIKPARKVRKVAVIGGGIGGMETARIAAMRGHKVTLYEKSDRLGGVFIAAAAPDFKEKDKRLIEWYKRQLSKLPVEIKFGTEIKDPAALDADVVVVATGAKPRRLNTPGIDKAIEAIDYLEGKKPVGDNVVVIGGGLTGCEIAYDLYNKGKHPVIVEMKNDLIAVRGVCLANSSYLRDFFNAKKVPVYLESKVEEIGDKEVKVKGADGKIVRIPADSVIVSVGYVPDPLAPASRKVKLVGDADGVGNLRTVVWRAWKVAESI